MLTTLTKAIVYSYDKVLFIKLLFQFKIVAILYGNPIKEYLGSSLTFKAAPDIDENQFSWIDLYNMQ